ncbi:hypothetical protein EHQ12_16575 [Leptospira gomenensis]|uniref:WGR domain-containing protein n=1 Tax=Leptospira gomenensis TaxID=2484974 RepID=A0A5F1YE30_9LEPT|nr:hypothetical protein [Leptospira gomenensis]TGK34343.1 hypothetical protein EHQ12_16575 [Leptospira gomenensis]TGK37295.1 hypothetical protein EHQ17_03685 [Leptospira gomenensis]TGK50982.1 hypothetical protein EHQ07_03750 [Leptospira gomenensis]TGK56604.1 hypothetical protein EHQ13_15675 [Leptospira gomenensis]
MKKHFLLSDNGTERFRQIEISGYSILISEGETGSVGRRTAKTFSNRQSCLQGFAHLVSEALSRGFTESSEAVPTFKPLTGDPNYPETWKRILDAPDRKQALRDQFRFLTETEECKILWDRILESITDARIDEEGRFVLTLPWSYDEETPVHLVWNPPYLGKIHSSVPQSMGRFVSIFNGMEIVHDDNDYPTFSIQGVGTPDEDSNKPAKVLDDYGWEAEILEEGESWWIGPLEIVGKDFQDVQSFGTYDESQNWFVYHPFIKNKYGEAAITRVEHGTCDLEVPEIEYGLGGFLLREICGWIRDIRPESDSASESYDTPVFDATFQEYVARRAVELSEEEPEIAKRLLEYNWRSLAGYVHATIRNWILFLAREGTVNEDVLVIDSYWDDAGEILFLGFDWHSGTDYEDAISEGANFIEYILDFTPFYANILGKSNSSEIDGSEVLDILGENYEIVRDILAYLSIENAISVLSGEEFKLVPRDKEGVYFAYSHFHDEEAEIAFHTSRGKEDSFFKKFFPNEKEKKEKRENTEKEQELIDDVSGEVLEDYPWVWKTTMEQSIDRLDRNFTENKDRYKREFDRVLEYKEKTSDEKTKLSLDDLAMQISSMALNRFLQSNKPELARWVLECYHELFPKLGVNRNSIVKGNVTGNSYNTAEYFAGDIIVFIAKYEGGKFLPLVETLLPSNIQDGRLAFNLACLNSLEKNKENTIRYTKLALSLGKPKTDFKDSDFDHFRDDPDFHALVAAQ